MRTKHAALIVVTMLGVAACTATSTTAKSDSAAMAMPETDPMAVRQAIDSANARSLDALMKLDTANMTNNYASDAVVMMTGMPAMAGRDNIHNGMIGMLSAVAIKNPKFTTLDVTVSGDLAVEHGTYELTVVPKGGKPAPDKGHYLTVWKKQPDGSWKIVRDISSSEMPAKG